MLKFVQSSLVLLLGVLLTACSSSSEPGQSRTSNLDTLVQPIPTCSESEFTGGSNWIEGQLQAFGERDPNRAYSYASEAFKNANSVEDFAAIISSQYSMLLDLRDFNIVSCDKDGDFFSYKVQITDNQGGRYAMEYLLSYIRNKWGIDGASVSYTSK